MPVSPFMLRIFGLVLASVCLVVLLAMLRLRDLATERREALRLKRLAEACAELVRVREQPAVIEMLMGHARTLLSAPARFFPGDGLPPPDDDGTGLRRALLGDGRLLGTIVLELGRPPRIAETAALMQLAASASSAIETLALLQRNADALAQATRSRLEAEQSRRELDAIMSSMSDAMMAFDLDWRLTYLNPNAAQLFSRDRGASVGAHLHSVFRADHEDDIEARLRHAARERTDAAFKIRWTTDAHGGAARPQWLMLRAFPHRGGMTLYVQDITKQEEIEEQLRQTAKMDALGQLTGGIAHDFNNLLTVVGGNLDLLQEVLAPDTAEREMVDMAQRAADSAAALTQKLLAFARRQPLSPADLNVRELLDKFCVLLRRTLGARIAVVFTAEPASWHVRADPVQLEAAILNLAINARDAMAQGAGGGTLTISITNRQIPQARRGVGRAFVAIEVSDTGAGIAADVLPRVFEPFFTTKPVGSGTGLGLSMVYGFVTQSGGLIELDSKPGQGTCVRLLLPRARGRARGRAVLARPAIAAAAAGRSARILVVEDEPGVRGFIERVLVRAGHDVVALGDGQACLDALEHGERADLLLTDIVLPGGIGGEQVAEAFGRRFPGLPIIAMSGYAGEAGSLPDRLRNGSALLLKPFKAGQLAERVSAALMSHLTEQETFVNLAN